MIASIGLLIVLCSASIDDRAGDDSEAFLSTDRPASAGIPCRRLWYHLATKDKAGQGRMASDSDRAEAEEEEREREGYHITVSIAGGS